MSQSSLPRIFSALQLLISRGMPNHSFPLEMWIDFSNNLNFILAKSKYISIERDHWAVQTSLQTHYTGQKLYKAKTIEKEAL